MLPGHSDSVCARVYRHYRNICLYSCGDFVVCDYIIFDTILCVSLLLYYFNYQFLFTVITFAVMST